MLIQLGRIKNYAEIATLVLRQQQLSLRHIPAVKEASQKHCILLHGWGATGKDMQYWAEGLRASKAGQSIHFWIPTYDTAWRTFPQSARAIKVLLEEQPFDFERTLIMGYSMGGLVARELVRAGFPFAQLVTLCSPHHGAAPWVPVWWRRTSSLKADSALLRNLNNSPDDAMHRSNYHFYGLTYNDPGGDHQHDGIVEIYSALGQDLNEVSEHQTYSITFEKVISGLNLSHPHICALYPKLIPGALENITRLLEDL